MRPRPSASERFLADFSPLERELGRGVVCPVERMIIELGLTPGRVRQLERSQGTRLPWFRAAYATLRQHRLLGPSTSWSHWLRRYQRRRSQAEKACPP